MGKQSNPRKLADSEAMSVVRNLRVSPQKLNLVAAMIRGMDVNKAVAALSFSRRRIAGDVKKDCNPRLLMRRITTLWMWTGCLSKKRMWAKALL